jgi:hypothetical protein
MTAARGITIALGLWLFISAFLWPHTYAQFTSSWVVGVLCVAFAVIAVWVPPARYLIAILAVWLFISAWGLPTRSPATVWNHVLVSIALFVVSLLPPTRARTSPTNAPRT